MQIIAFSIQASAPPFPSFVIAYTINGFGGSLEDAQANGFVANYKDNAAEKMGILHAAYGKGYPCSILVILSLSIWWLSITGAGALVSPLIATQFAQLHRWSFHYLISLAVATLNTVLLICIFRFKTQDGEFTFFCLFENIPNHMFDRHTECLAQIGQTVEEKESVGGSKYKEMFKLKALHILAIFSLVYVGVEVTISGKSRSISLSCCLQRHGSTTGWIVTYMIRVRHGGPSSGYISTGFFGGKHAIMDVN